MKKQGFYYLEGLSLSASPVQSYPAWLSRVPTVRKTARGSFRRPGPAACRQAAEGAGKEEDASLMWTWFVAVDGNQRKSWQLEGRKQR